jgi:hypothetical protein
MMLEEHVRGARRAVVDAWPSVRVPTLIFIFSRAAIFLVAHWSLMLDPKLHVQPPGEPVHNILALCRWDCGWYIHIAEEGYTDKAYANFFPLFPLLARTTHAITSLRYDIVLILLANIFAFVGFVVVYRVFCRLEGEDVAATGLALIAAWPFSFFQAASYPESLMLAASALAILLAERGKHIRAGVAVGLGALARHLTIFAGGALLVAQLRERGASAWRLVSNRAFLGLLIPLAIAGLYPLYLHYRFGDAFVWLNVRKGIWGDVAWEGLPGFFASKGWQTHFATFFWLSLIPGLGALSLLRTRRHWALAAYAIPLILCLWLVGLAALGRYTQSVWPGFLPWAVALARRPMFRVPVVLSFSMLQGLFLYLYVHWYWIY